MMRRRKISVAKQLARSSILAGGLLAILPLTDAGTARADENFVLVAKIDVGGKGLGAFDISVVDPVRDLYILSDRTNASIDFFDASDNTFIARIDGFKGSVLNPDGTANTNLSGPDGAVVVGHKEVWAGDGDSTLKVIDIDTFKVVDTISTGGSFRADEMAWDSSDHILAVANDADSPPFVTLVNTDTRAIVAKIPFDGSNGAPVASNGLEQPQWSATTGMFYQAVPGIDPKDATLGGVSVIDPVSMRVVATYPLTNCSPAGLTLGPNRQALVGCSASFGTSPNVITQSIVIDITNGDQVATFPQIGGSDEVWYDGGTKHYYLGARNAADNTGKKTPVLGAIDAKTNALDGTVSTSSTAHSVAADRRSHHIFVPIGFVPPGSPAGTDATNPCPDKGCIAVYLPSASDDDDGTKEAKR